MKPILITLSLVAAAGAAHAAPAPRLGPEAQKGQRLFVDLGCASCHGTVGQGGAGPKLAPTPRPLAFLQAYVRSPAGDMPPYTPRLVSDADLGAVHAFLTSVPAPSGGPR